MDTAALAELDMRLLLTFDAVRRNGTFGKAADDMGYTQSAVSQQVARLEHLVGGDLFVRPGGPRPVEVTRLGELFATHADVLLERARVAARDLNAFHAGDLGEVHVGTFQSVSTAILPTILTSLRRDHPKVAPKLFARDSYDELVRLVAEHVVDLSFCHIGDPIDIGDLEYIDLFEDPYVLLCRAGRFPAGPVHPAALDGLSAIGDESDTCRQLADEGLAVHGAQLDVTFRTVDNGTIRALVKASDQVAMIPLLAVEAGDPELSMHELDPPIPPRRIGLVWRRDSDLSPAARTFIDLAVSATQPHRQRGFHDVA